MKRVGPSCAGKHQKNSRGSGHFGLHLTLDGYWGDPRKLNDRRLIRRALSELPGRIGLKPLSSPLVVRAPDNHLKDPGGWSGFVIIQESHISIHTFPRRRFVSIDVYSCRDFDPSPVRRYFRRIFGVRTFENHLVVRGIRYPRYNLV